MDSRRILIFPILLLLFSFTIPIQACGCGLMVSATEDGWEYGDDSVENAFIAYNNGIEHLLISLDVQKRDFGAVLIIPIPASPQDIKADIPAETPIFSGYNIQEKATENLESIKDTLFASQIYTIPIWMMTELLSSSLGLAPTSIGSIPTSLPNNEIDVYQHIEKEGMIAEVLTAKTSDALYSYLQAKGLRVQKDSIPVFKDYINEDFSFVVAWIDPAKENLSAKGITATFPTNQIFYPLKPNSAYNSMVVKPKNIIVLGYKTPTIYNSIKEGTRVEYLYSESGLTFQNFINTEKGFGFTKIVLNTSPKNMQEDLYIKDTSPVNITLAHVINQWTLAFGVFLLIITSAIATRLSLRIVKPLYTLLGVSFYKLVLFNSATLIGTALGASRYIATKKSRYIVVFSITFLGVTLLLTSILKMIINL